MSAKPPGIKEWIERYLQEEAPRSKSLIVSVFGDSVAPYAPGIWLGALIDLLAPLGVNERLVRTSAFRLVDEGWLRARRDGRRSHYSLTASGIRRFDAAYHRIYTPPPEVWNGDWTIVMLPRDGENAPERLELRRELEWEGYGSPIPGVLLHPVADHEALQRTLTALKLDDRAVVLSARSVEGFTAGPPEALVQRCWNLDGIAERYGQFITRFQPLRERLAIPVITPQQAFIVQTLLIHSFRRATLHDPRLPVSMLPPEWPGMQAYRLCREIYQRTYRGAQSHLRSVAGIDTEAPSNSKLNMGMHQRFGGLS